MEIEELNIQLDEIRNRMQVIKDRKRKVAIVLGVTSGLVVATCTVAYGVAIYRFYKSFN